VLFSEKHDCLTRSAGGLPGAAFLRPSLAQDVKYNFMPGTDFSKLKTYKWVPIQSNVHPDQIVDQQIKPAVDSQLAPKGLAKTESENAELYVGYQLRLTKKTVGCLQHGRPLALRRGDDAGHEFHD